MMLKWTESKDQDGKPSGIIFDLSHYRQHDILYTLYGVDTQSKIKILRKITLPIIPECENEKMGDNEYKSLVFFIKLKTSETKILQAMQHWDRIPFSILEPLYEYFRDNSEMSPFIKILPLQKNEWALSGSGSFPIV